MHNQDYQQQMELIARQKRAVEDIPRGLDWSHWCVTFIAILYLFGADTLWIL